MTTSLLEQRAGHRDHTTPGPGGATAHTPGPVCAGGCAIRESGVEYPDTIPCETCMRENDEMKIRLAVIVVAFCLFSSAYAQDKLPNELTGSASWSRQDGRKQFVVPFDFAIESQESDGAIKGKMTTSLPGGCVVTDRPFSGMYRDGALELSAPRLPNCGPLKFTMNRTSASEFVFEGTLRLPNSQSASVIVKQK